MNLMKSNNEEEKELILLKMDGFLCTYLNLNTGEIEYSLAECFPEVEKDLKTYQATVTWSNEIPILKQLAILKRLYPPLNELSRKELLEEIKHTSNWTFGSFLEHEAQQLIKEAQLYRMFITVQENS